VALDLAAVRRYSRQIALPDFGAEGQSRLAEAEVVVVGNDLLAETVALYLSGAGVGRLRRIGKENWPAGEAWLSALKGASLIVRSGFDDDPVLRAAVRLGIPMVAARATAAGVDVLSFREHGPCPHAALDVPSRAAAPNEGDAALGGTLAAAEAVWQLGRPGAPRARHLRLGADGEPLVQEIPWAPECFACGGQGREASFQ
jgi:hypothetical protein